MRWLTNNFGIKLASLALAAMLSAYVYLYINYPTTQNLYIPLRVRDVADSLVISKRQPDVERVLLRVRGPYRSIKQILNSNHQATVDCSEVIKPGTEALRVQLPEFGDVVITGQDPSFISLQFEKKATAKLRIGIDRLGSPQHGFIVASDRLSQSEVEITGPQALVSRIKQAQIEPNIEGAAQDAVTDEVVHLYGDGAIPLDDPSLRIVPLGVRYSIRLVPQGDTKALTVVPEYLGLPPQQYIIAGITAEPAYIAVKADLVPEGVSTVRTKPVDLSQAREDFTAEVGLVYPFELPQDSNLPTICAVHVAIASLADEHTASARAAVELQSMQGGLEYVLAPPEVLLRSSEFAGLADKLQKQIRVVINVEGLTPGEYYLTPQVNLPAPIDHVTIIPNTVKLTIIQGRK